MCVLLNFARKCLRPLWSTCEAVPKRPLGSVGMSVSEVRNSDSQLSRAKLELFFFIVFLFCAVLILLYVIQIDFVM